MKIDLTCPVELWQYAIPTETNAECTFVMNNLSDKVVISVQVSLNCFDQNDELLFRQTERMLGLKAGVGERFTVAILPSEWNGVEGVDLVIEKVWFDDATVWRRGNAPLTYYTPNALQPGRALDDLRFVAGQDAVGYPQMQDMVWMCVCGRANALDSDRCCRCERRRETVFASYQRDNVNHIIAAHEQKLAEAARKAREENNILQENREKQRAAQRRRRIKVVRWLATLALLAAAAVIMVVWGIPTVRYNTAADLLANGHYDQASAAFAEMGAYRDAAAQVLECDYQKALSLRDQGSAGEMEQAEALFRVLADYGDSADQASRTAYALGDLYLEAGSYEQAVEKFQSLGTYQDSADKLNETIYRQAQNMLENGSHEAARVLFAGLAAYGDAAAKVDECTFLMAELKAKNGDYQGALALLGSLNDYEGAAQLIGSCYYALAEADLEAGEFEAAGEWFLLAGDYQDARDRANECLYKLAEATRDSGEYEKAMELFLRIPAYLDSEEQARRCVYEQAELLMENGDLANAAALLESITTYEDARALLDECRFRLAEDALENGDAEQAERLLESIAEHKGLETQLKKVRYQLAENALEAGEYQSALERYELLENYKDSAAKAKQCRYALADAVQSAGDYEQAIAMFEALNGYRDSKTRIKACQYAVAEAAVAAGEYERAISLFEALGSYEDSREQLAGVQFSRAMALRDEGGVNETMQALEAMGENEEAQTALDQLRMEEAQRLEREGQYAKAAEFYVAVNTPEAQERVKACRYELAVQLRQSGDLPGAAAAFHELDDYQDAAAQSEACYNEYYGQVAQAAREAAKEKKDAEVISILRGFEMNVLSETYDDLPELLDEACLAMADSLYAEGRPYEAIPYYQQAGAKEKLERRAYLIIGQWESATGKTAEFRTDGTCSLMGEELYFRVSNFSLYTGPSPEEMTITHKISVLDKLGMSLRDQRNGQDVLYKLSRTGRFELPQMDLPAETPAQYEDIPAPTPEPAAEPAFVPVITAAPEILDEMLVTEDSDEPKE